MIIDSKIPTYKVWRERAIAACASPWEHHFFATGEKGPQGEALGIGAFVKAGRDVNRPWIVHVSGTHGIEGYLGSDVQTEILSHKEFCDDTVNVLLIHGLNSYGMAWYRRANQKNVDLNRNSIEHGKEVLPWEPSYNDLHFLDLTPSSLIKIWNFAKTAGRLGISKVIDQFASGQSEYTRALFYTGSEPQMEIKIFSEILRRFLIEPTKICFIDVHTGLGAYAAETLFVNEKGGDYDSKGMLSLAVKRLYPRVSVHAVVEEFGTRSMAKVFFGLLKENRHFHSVGAAHFQPDLAQSQLDLFYPDDQVWRAKCLDKAIDFFAKTYNNLKF